MAGKLTVGVFAILIAAFILLLNGCAEPTYEDQLESFVSYVREHRIGTNPNAMLEKRISTTEWTPVALFFGYYTDFDVCQTLVREYKELYPKTILRCVPAN